MIEFQFAETSYTRKDQNETYYRKKLEMLKCIANNFIALF